MSNGMQTFPNEHSGDKWEQSELTAGIAISYVQGIAGSHSGSKCSPATAPNWEFSQKQKETTLKGAARLHFAAWFRKPVTGGGKACCLGTESLKAQSHVQLRGPELKPKSSECSSREVCSQGTTSCHFAAAASAAVSNARGTALTPLSSHAAESDSRKEAT